LATHPVMHFEGRLASGSEEICDLFAKFIQRTYAHNVWVPSDPGPEHCRMTHLLARCIFFRKTTIYFFTGLWQRAFFATGGRFSTLLRYSRKVGETTLKTIVAWQYHLNKGYVIFLRGS
jgi:hypothetical protein